MSFFSRFVSNTSAGSANQSFFSPADPTASTLCRTYLRVSCSGTFPTSFLFSNIVDSTFADGSHSRCNRVLESWNLQQARLGVVPSCAPDTPTEPSSWQPISFHGLPSKTVAPGEFFASDPLSVSAHAGEFVCLEFSFAGPEIPCHPESLLASFVFENNRWVPSPNHPFPAMMGVERSPLKRIAFLGDSITQGIGTPCNSYAHWNALVAEQLGPSYACWNLGIGFARASDAASIGAWLYKARQNDLVVVCLGVNDLLHRPEITAESVVDSLSTIVEALQKAGIRVVLQTIPPFDYTPEKTLVWQEANRLLFARFSSLCPIFDVVPHLSLSPEEPQRARFGGHPDPAGCRVWADALYPFLLQQVAE